MALKEGDKAPDFSLPASSGGTISLKGLAGKKVVLYFYPKDNTSGCTTEACSFRDADAKLKKAGAVVLGVSADSIASHQKFAGKYSLPFALLSDEGSKVATVYEAWGEKSLYGRKYMGMFRKTFLIDEKGKLTKIWPKVKPEGHAEEVLAAIKG
ncbi:MAG: thioredoxin-dependent thiol peroxidase [Chloroflexi bacterium]|nr:thioredoxin-dependent thiol peroxidase [Chloroflexota bacterium]